ncbi:hypothetical protein BDC45DRAFT_508117 [Circinella umbellata]|nr:hypothetical protein BDC45DRAFT_508117 [Circinella umbellata]
MDLNQMTVAVDSENLQKSLRGKMYSDKLKLSLMAKKKHLNNSLKQGVNCPYPFLMIMDFDIIAMTMEFVEDVGYIIKKDQSCSFPISKKSLVEENGIQNIINIISRVKVMIQFNHLQYKLS